MKKLFYVAATIAIIIAGIYGTYIKSQGKPAGDKPVVKIGVIAPLSGDSSQIGINCRNGIEYAINNIKNPMIEYKLIVEDDTFKLAKAATIANKLINVDKVNMLFTCSAISGNAAVSIADNHKKFMMTVIASAQEIATLSPYSFLHWSSPQKEAEKAYELAQKINAKKVVIFEENHAGASALANAYRRVMADHNIETATFSFMSGERNFHEIIEKAKRENADMIMLLALPPCIDIIVKNIKEKGIETPYTSIEIPSLIENRAAFEGVEFVDVNDGQSDMIENYKSKYNTESVYGVAYAYDAMMIINNIVAELYQENGRIPTSEEMTQRLLMMDGYSGAVGDVSVDEDGMLNSEAVIKVIKNNKPVMVK